LPGFTAPCKEGLLFVSSNPIKPEDTKFFDNFTHAQYRQWLQTKRTYRQQQQQQQQNQSTASQQRPCHVIGSGATTDVPAGMTTIHNMDSSLPPAPILMMNNSTAFNAHANSDDLITTMPAKPPIEPVAYFRLSPSTQYITSHHLHQPRTGRYVMLKLLRAHRSGVTGVGGNIDVQYVGFWGREGLSDAQVEIRFNNTLGKRSLPAGSLH
jgi:hypothetical protein